MNIKWCYINGDVDDDWTIWVKKMSNFFSIIIGQKEDKEEKMKTPMFH